MERLFEMDGKVHSTSMTAMIVANYITRITFRAAACIKIHQNSSDVTCKLPDDFTDTYLGHLERKKEKKISVV